MLTHNELFWSLPSPRAFCQSITEAALGARAILINNPVVKTLEYGVMEGLRNANIHQPLILIIEDGTNISNTLAPHFGNEPMHANQLAAVQIPQPQAIILRSTTERSHTHCSKYMTEFIEEIIKTTGNLRLMVSLQDKTIKKNVLGNMSTDQFAVVVYDGTLKPEEMQAYISYRMLGREELGSTSLIRHLVTDFASYDVALADKLIQMSRDEILGLPNSLTRLIAEDENRWLSGDWLQGSESLTSPTERHPLREWYLASHSSPLTVIGRTAAEKRYWRACLKAISPWLEEHRPAVLKEDQAQNTCIFSTEFALRLMGDVQEYFITEKVRNFYSVSISGYHIAEAGANPITQLALTLSNGFTFVEYYVSRGMSVNDFAPNLSFFFSNGIDPEYAVIGRVARRIWAKAMKLKYGADARSQMLKYHIQTSGRSLHAQEIDFNDIRTTLQALYAIYDNCNSLHTNAYDEAITTPTEESVRRAMAIQLIINRELGLAKNENPLQGSFIIEELTDLVEEAVLLEFDRITERGGVLGAMETMYQRGKIQEESMHYEMLKHTGEYPIIGVNTFLSSKGSPTVVPAEVIRATEEEKQYQIDMLVLLHERNAAQAPARLKQLQQIAVANGNLFAELMETVKYCSLGQITNALFEVGGQYRRNM